MSMSNFEAEMSRFESEILNGGSANGPPRMPLMPPVPPPGMFPPMMPGIPPLPPPPPGVMAQLLTNNNPNPTPARLPPRPAFVPHQLRHRVPQQSIPFSSSSARSNPMSASNPSQLSSAPTTAAQTSNIPPQQQQQQQQQQPVLSAQPLLYKNQPSNDKPSSVNETNGSGTTASSRSISIPITDNKAAAAAAPKSDKTTVVPKPESNPHPVSKAYATLTQPVKESNERDAEASSSSKKKSKPKPQKKPRFVRMAGGTTWEDESLADWDPDDFRLFCGDLGNEVNDDVLTRAFNKYPSFQKARVVRDKRSGKTRGFGFVSFKDSQDYIRAMREMNGKYVGNRPIKLRKSNWRDRNIEVVRKKIKDKVKMGLR